MCVCVCHVCVSICPCVHASVGVHVCMSMCSCVECVIVYFSLLLSSSLCLCACVYVCVCPIGVSGWLVVLYEDS